MANWLTETFSTQATKVKKLITIFPFSYHNFEDTVTNFDKDMFKKQFFVVQILKTHLKESLFVFNCRTMLAFTCCSVLAKMLRNC